MSKKYLYTPYFCVCSQAAIYGHMEVVKVLVNDRASIDIQNNKKETAIMLVSILTVSESRRRYACKLAVNNIPWNIACQNSLAFLEKVHMGHSVLHPVHSLFLSKTVYSQVTLWTRNKAYVNINCLLFSLDYSLLLWTKLVKSLNIDIWAMWITSRSSSSWSLTAHYIAALFEPEYYY